jgi:hypothetical protein
LDILFSTVIRTIHVWLHRCPTAFPHYLRHNWSIYHIEQLFYSLLMSVGVLCCYQPSYHGSFHIAIIFKFVTTKIHETGHNRLATVSPEAIKTSVGC